MSSLVTPTKNDTEEQKSATVFCGSSKGNNILLRESAKLLGKELAKNKIRLVGF